MALTKKQENIILKGMRFNKRRNSKTFIEILEENCIEANLVKVATAVKTELVSVKTARKTAIDKEITDLNA